MINKRSAGVAVLVGMLFGGWAGQVALAQPSGPYASQIQAALRSIGFSASPSTANTPLLTLTKSGIATTSTTALRLRNATPATAGVPVQISPRLQWSGTAWDTAASQTTDMWAEVVPTSAGTPTFKWRLWGSLNGAAGAQVFEVTNSGTVTAAGTIATTSDVQSGIAAYHRWASSTRMSSPSDGVLLFANNANTDFTRLQFGGTTSSFPSVKRNGTGIDFRLADDSGYAGVVAGTLNSNTWLGAGGVVTVGGSNVVLSSGFGTSPTFTGRASSLRVNVGTGAPGAVGVMTMGTTAAVGWNCHIDNLTANAANRANERTVQTASTTTTVSIQNQLVSTGAAQNWVASDILALLCLAY